METTTKVVQVLRQEEAATWALVEKKRIALAQQASDGTPYKTLNISLMEVVEREVETSVYKMAADFLEFGGTFSIHEWLFKLIGAGADDTWSGRTNDLARVAYDSKRRAAQRVESIVTTWANF